MSIRIIKKYSNRKLYDVKKKRYINFARIKLLAEAGEKIQIIDNETKEDITDVVLGRIAPAENDIGQKIDELKFAELKKNTQEKITLDEPFYFIDLFCGAGGLSCGLEMAGLECVFGADMDKRAVETFKLNHKNASSFLGSIADLTKETLLHKIGDKKIKLIAGGPPCQGFSTIGKGDPNDEKNSLFKHYCRILEILRPEYLLFENVTGLVAKKNQAVLNAILEKFKELGYRVIVKVLESQHYGVPQKRKRTILFGTRLNKSIEFPTPIFGISRDQVEIPSRTVGDALNNLKTSTGEIFNHEVDKAGIVDDLTRERVKHIPEGRGIRYKKDEDELLPDHLKLGVDWENIREGRLRELNLYRLDRSRPAPTINTQSHHYYHPVEIRRFTAREFASFQSFPSYFVFLGARNAQIKQIGNAVPPLMAKALGQQVIKSYKSEDLSNEINEEVNVQSIRSNAFTYDNFDGLRENWQRGSKKECHDMEASCGL